MSSKLLKGRTVTLVAKNETSIASHCQNIIVPKNSKLKKAIWAAVFEGKTLQALIVNALHK